MVEKSKDVVIDGEKYKISRVNALDGGWILRMVMKSLGAGQVLDGIQPEADQATLTEAEWRRLQQLCLSVCAKYNVQGLAIPILTADGRWAVPELEYDAVTVQGLFMHSQAFQTSPFFAGGGFQRIRESLEVSSPSAIPASTSSSGDPSSPASGVIKTS